MTLPRFMPLFICQHWKPSAGRMPLKQQEGRCRRTDTLVCPLSPAVPRTRVGQWGWGTNTVLAIQHVQAQGHCWPPVHLEVERPEGGLSPRGAGSALYCARDGSCYVLSRGNEISRDMNCLEKITQELTSSQTSLPTVANAL